jgi:hypothetical protein
MRLAEIEHGYFPIIITIFTKWKLAGSLDIGGIGRLKECEVPSSAEYILSNHF